MTFFQAVSHTIGLIHSLDSKKWSHDDKPFLVWMEVQIPQKVQVRGKCYPCDGFASVKLFSVNYLGLHLVRKCETQQTCKHCESTSPMAEIHSSHNHEFIITQSLFFNHVCETAWQKNPFQRTSGINGKFFVTGISDKMSDWLNSFSALGSYNHSITLKCTWNYRIIIIIIIIIVIIIVVAVVIVIIIILVTCACSGLGPVVQRLDNSIHRINRYPADKC